MNERELDFQLGDANAEIQQLRIQLQAATSEALSLRHALEHIYALAHIATQPKEVTTHDDKASY